jgi:hypothetical protein
VFTLTSNLSVVRNRTSSLFKCSNRMPHAGAMCELNSLSSSQNLAVIAKLKGCEQRDNKERKGVKVPCEEYGVEGLVLCQWEASNGNVSFSINKSHNSEVIGGMHDRCALHKVAERADEFQKIIKLYTFVVLL